MKKIFSWCLCGKTKPAKPYIIPPPHQDKELERQTKLVSMKKTLEEMKEKIEADYQKVGQIQAQVKKLISEKKKNEAKRQIQILKAIQQELVKQENMCLMLEKTKIQLEGIDGTNKITDALKDAVGFQKEAEKNREFLEDFLMEKREMDENNKAISKLLNDLAAGDEEEREEIDEMYKGIEFEVHGEEMNKNKNPLKNATKPQVQSHTPQQMEGKSIGELLKDAEVNHR